MKVILKSDKFNLKKPQHLKENVYVLYSLKIVIIETANSRIMNRNIILKLPLKAKAFVATRFRGEDIQGIDKQKQRLWIAILNESYFERLTIIKDTPLGFLVIKPENLKVQYEAIKRPKKQKGLPKNWDEKWKSYWQKKKTSSTKRRFS